MDTSPVLTDAEVDAIVACSRDERAFSAKRREGARHAFPVIQRVAPYERGYLPILSQFRRVQCRDISAGGFSFLWPSSPDFTHVMAALGSPPNLIYVTARVVHCRPANEPQSGFLVGCCILGRIRSYVGA